MSEAVFHYYNIVHKLLERATGCSIIANCEFKTKLALSYSTDTTGSWCKVLCCASLRSDLGRWRRYSVGGKIRRSAFDRYLATDDGQTRTPGGKGTPITCNVHREEPRRDMIETRRIKKNKENREVNERRRYP